MPSPVAARAPSLHSRDLLPFADAGRKRSMSTARTAATHRNARRRADTESPQGRRNVRELKEYTRGMLPSNTTRRRAAGSCGAAMPLMSLLLPLLLPSRLVNQSVLTLLTPLLPLIPLLPLLPSPLLLLLPPVVVVMRVLLLPSPELACDGVALDARVSVDAPRVSIDEAHPPFPSNCSEAPETASSDIMALLQKGPDERS